MPPKRNLVPEHEEERNSTPSSSKRARTGSDDDDEPVRTQTRTQRDRKAKGKNARQDADADDEDEDEADLGADIKNTEDEIDDDQFEAKFGSQVRAHLESKRRVEGTVAEHGIIEYVEMTQFMCHKFLKFTFGPQINFIIGHNGSGKSAVLSAITIALGGKTASTGRGAGLSSFIREGQNQAEVTIHIKNQGDEAYKPKEYGKTIIISRRIHKEGSPSWKIMGANGKVVSTKKDELAAICDHMNIQVDNPMNVLTQDAARQFLSASAPQDKYKFFLRGTQLTQLSDEYDLCLTNITKTQKLLAVKKDAIPDLKVRVREATIRWEEAEKAREQKQKAIDLKKELAWSHVAGKEEELEKQAEEVGKLKKRLPKIEENVRKAEEAFDAASAEVLAQEAEHNNLGSLDELSDEKKRLQTQMNQRKGELRAVVHDVKQLDSQLSAAKETISSIEKQIDTEAKRMERHTQAKHDETQAKIEAQRGKMQSCEERIQKIILDRKAVGIDADKIRDEGVNMDRRIHQLREQIQTCETTINSARDSEKDKFVPYGRNISTVMQKIKSMNWRGDMPLGPLGQYVKARDPQTWGGILRSQLGQYLTAFAITNAADRAPLKKLLVESGNGLILIIIYEKDNFDYRHGEPPEHILTVLRALDISDPYVLRILINQARIESQLLAPTRREGEASLRTLRGGSAWTLDKFAVRVYNDGGVSTQPLNVRQLSGATNLLLTGRDTAADVRHFAEEKVKFEAEWSALTQEVAQKKAAFHKLKTRLEQFNNDERRIQNEQASAKRVMNQLINEANDDLPAGLAGLEGAKEEATREMEGIMRQAEEVLRQKSDLDNSQREVQDQINGINERLRAFENLRHKKEKIVEAAVEKRMQAQNQKKYYEEKLKAEKSKVNTAEEVAKVLEEEFSNWTAKAAEFCEQVQNPRKAAEVQRQLESVQNALKEREKRQGASVEEMGRELNKAKEAFEKADQEVRQMLSLNKALRRSIATRISRWHEFRRHIALRCKHVFQFHLSHRGYYGKILFDHQAGSLQLRVQTDDQLQTQGQKDKDPRALSGGEKSFSTICLLLSLWESIGCPIRCLDEFDVFMDAINRRISMSMMIETAKTSDKKQYVLITPQDMTNVTMGSTVKVHRMMDPERGGMLPFGAGGA